MAAVEVRVQAPVEVLAQGAVRRPDSPRWRVVVALLVAGSLLGATVAGARTAEQTHTLVGTVVDRYTADPFGAGSFAPPGPLLGDGYVVVVRDENARVIGTARLRAVGREVTWVWGNDVVTATYAYTVTGLPKAASYWLTFGAEHRYHLAYTYDELVKAGWHVVDPRARGGQADG